MKNSSLQLKHYFFPLIFVSAQKDADDNSFLWDKEYKVLYQPFEKLAIEKTVSQTEDKERIYRVSLYIETIENEKLPYQFAMHCVGDFEISDTFHGKTQEETASERLKLVAVNGASVLYSVCRELLIAQTAKSAYGSIILPTIAFSPTCPERLNVPDVPDAESAEN